MSDIKPEPGRQYVCQVYERLGEVVLTRVYYFNDGPRWLNTASGGQYPDAEVTILRPLYTLDLGAYGIETFVHELATLGLGLSSQIQRQIPKPARMDEPAWGGKVIAHTLSNAERRTFLRYKFADPDFRWADGIEQYRWAELIDPAPYKEES